MTLEKLAKLRDRYAETVTAYQDATRTEDKKAMAKAKRSRTAAGKAYLKGIDEALVTFTHESVREVTCPYPEAK